MQAQCFGSVGMAVLQAFRRLDAGAQQCEGTPDGEVLGLINQTLVSISISLPTA